jgi:hypothetical protein
VLWPTVIVAVSKASFARLSRRARQYLIPSLLGDYQTVL